MIISCLFLAIASSLKIRASSKVSNPFPIVDLFLVVYEDTLKWKAEIVARNYQKSSNV
jgi:hypothetical protein